MSKLIVFLIRKKLGVNKYEQFKFANQKSKDDTYYFTDDRLFKLSHLEDGTEKCELSRVSLNWLMNDECLIFKVTDLAK